MAHPRSPDMTTAADGPSSRGERGQTLALFGLMLAVLLGLVGMSIDVGHLVVNRRNAQNAADAAALAGVGVLNSGGSHTQAVAAAVDYAGKHGLTNVTVNHPPLSGPGAGDLERVEVIVEKPVQKYLIQVVYGGDWKVTARAVGRRKQIQHGFGVIALNPSQCNSLHMDSNAQLNVANGGIFVNSTCQPNAFSMDSNAVAHANLINVTGGFEGGSNYDAVPEPLENQNPVPDPFAGIPTPPVGGGILRMGNNPSSPCGNFGGNGSQTFLPGLYNCRMELGTNFIATFQPGDYTFTGGFIATSNVQITFGRGIYVFQGTGPGPQANHGGFRLASNVEVDGSAGVLLYNTCRPSPCVPGANSGPIDINSNSGLTLTPYGDPYSNITIWQDRNSVTTVNIDSNGSATAVSGAIYAKSAHLNYDSNAVVPLQFVASTVDIDSNAVVDVNVENLAKVTIYEIALSE